ncbi:7301_t:CDS:2 [Paraglomus brasilianum]|uniref:tRNA (adenine(58)-N(1))-methyltransferase catalytic subunit TRM61 n=1 Tax=Paraglomus brasilianum TaxID=144538 RepID=A0A9N8Z586_9GLOM|nr:7301_t:CDS:2 [Paraglomus brasilianum]
MPVRSKVKKADVKKTLFTIQFPTLDEYVVLKKRITTPVYPKDAASIVSLLDLHPHARVLDAGTGNGSLTLYLARALHPSGHVHSVDKSALHLSHAKHNVERFARGLYLPTISFSHGKLSSVLNSLPSDAPLYDGAALDMPTPWSELESVFKRLKNDKYVVCYLPNITQVLECMKEIERKGLAFAVEQVLEINWRPWDIKRTVIRGSMRDSTDEKLVDKPWLRTSEHGENGSSEKSVENNDSSANVGEEEEVKHEQCQNVVKEGNAEYEENGDLEVATPRDPENAAQESQAASVVSDARAWICRPGHPPTEHTAFLLQLRKKEYSPDNIIELETPNKQNRFLILQ